MELNTAKKAQTEAFEHLSSLIQGISSPVRLKLLFFLSHGAQTVEVLSQKLDQTLANTSMHLRKMHQLGLVDAKSEGQKRRYSLSNESLHQLWEALQTFGFSVDTKIHQSLKEGSRWDFDKDIASLHQALKKKNHELVDLRPAEERERNPFAKSLCAQDLEHPHPEKTYYLLCRGKFCALSSSWAHELNKQNIKAYKLPFSAYEIEQYYLSLGDQL